MADNVTQVDGRGVFKGSDEQLCNSIDALLDLNAKGAVSHRVPGMAVTLLEAAADRIAATRPAPKADSALVGESVAEAAARFCAELQEDGEGVPKAELAALHEALNEWEGLGPRRSMFDDRTRQTSALADLEVIERDPHATDRQRRIAARAVVAFSQYAAIPDLLQAVEELLFGDDRQSEAGELKALLKVRVAYERAREGDPK